MNEQYTDPPPNRDHAAREVLTDILTRLDQSGVVYALLHPGSEGKIDLASDVDIVFAESPRIVLEPVLLALAETGRLRLLQAMHYDTPSGYYYVIQPLAGGGNCHLQLDCLCDLHGINRYHVDTGYLLKDRERRSGIWRVSPSREALYLIIKRAIKGGRSHDKALELANAIHSAPDSLQDDLHIWLGRDRAQRIFQYASANEPERLLKEVVNARGTLQRGFALRHPVRTTARLLGTGWRQIKRTTRPSGFFIVLVGPDGCGKSTVTAGLMSSLQRAFRKTWRFHWRPKLLPKLGRGDGTPRDQAVADATVSAAPPTTSSYRGLVSLVRYLYYWLDFVFGYWVKIYPRKARSTFIIGERYFPDVLVNPERYGFAVPRTLMRITALLVPKPDLVILLSGNPEDIHNRKPELTVDRIGAQLGMYTEELPFWGNHAITDTGSGATSVINNLQSLVEQLLQARHTGVQVTTEKRVFPALGTPRLLLDPEMPYQLASRLYTPGSRSGRIAMGVLRIAGPVSRLVLTRTIRSVEFGNFPLSRSELMIRSAFPERSALSVSYYLGNRGPRSKITAQVAGDTRILAYVKIGCGNEVSALLDNESRTLTLLDKVTALDAQVPKLLQRMNSNAWLHVFLSPPRSPARNSGLTFDAQHEAFVHSVFSTSVATMTLKSLDGAKRLSARLAGSADIPELNGAYNTCQRAWRLLEVQFRDTPLVTGRAHGDFSPWNVLAQQGAGYFVFDWEYSEDKTPAFNDLFHFLRMPLHLVRQFAASRTAACLVDMDGAHGDLLRQHAARYGIGEQMLPAYCLLYLLREYLRHAETGGGGAELLRHLPGQLVQMRYLAGCINTVCDIIKTGHRRPRVLVSAYACESDKGSEPGVGWHWVQEIGAHNEAWIITRTNNRDSINRGLCATPNPYLHFIYADLPPWLRFWKRKQRGVRTYYYLWQFFALRKARSAHRRVDFDLAHHVTFVNDWLWAFPALLRMPFVWGPIGSHPPCPGFLLPHRRARLTESVRLAIQRGARLLDPLFWLTTLRATHLIAINRQTRNQFPLSLRSEADFAVEPAIAVEAPALDVPERTKAPFTALYVGRFHYTKCPHLALEAFAGMHPRESDARLQMVGRGPEEACLKALAGRLGIEDNVDFLAWCPREDVLRRMSEANVFLFPSTEGGGMVVLEAMAHGLPVVCLDYGGPGSIVSSDCGIKVPVQARDTVVQGLADALKLLAADSALRDSLSACCRRYAREQLAWQSKGKIIQTIYSRCIAARRTRSRRTNSA